MTTIKALLYKNKLLLKEHNIDSWQIDAELMLCFVLNKKREYLISHDSDKINFFKIIKYKYLIYQRIKGYSVAVILGIKSFFGRDFIVNKKVLIPRPETEMIVETALAIIYSKTNNFTVIDIGTGSGCIITTVASECKNKINNYLAIDISKTALTTARKNIEKYQLTDEIITFRGNLITPILENKVMNNGNDIIITANLPYLTKKQIDNAPSIQKEPRLALLAKEKGLALYRELFEQVQLLQKNHNNNIHILCEIDPSQSDRIKKLQKNILPNWNFEIKKDFAKQDRLVIISNKNTYKI